MDLKADQIQINGKDNKVATVQFKDDLTYAQDNKLVIILNRNSVTTPQINTVSPIIGQGIGKMQCLH